MTSTPPNLVHPLSGKVDVFVGGAGTGGTVSGVARGIKKAHNPVVLSLVWTLFVNLVTPVDFCLHALPQVGSMLALPASLNEASKGCSYAIEGIGYDFAPDVLTRDPGMIDTWVKTNDTDAFAAVQLLMRHETMLVGGSSGSSLAGALAWLRSESGREISQTPGMNVVVMLPDGCVSSVVSLRQVVTRCTQP